MHRNVLIYTDYTRLTENDTEQDIIQLCETATQTSPHVAAVCVHLPFVALAKHCLAHTSIKVATVINFPDGRQTIPHVLQQLEHAHAAGADEIDCVFPYTTYLEGQQAHAQNLMTQVHAYCLAHQLILKVIIETGALPSEKMAQITHDAIEWGADFIKTSTGKISIGATLDAANIILHEIKTIHRPVGIKLSGGLRSLEQANMYLQLAEEIMGADWVTPAHFRLGTSQLLRSTAHG